MSSANGPAPWPSEPGEPIRVEPALPLVVQLAEPEPRPPHPGFWWSVLWCLAFLLVTQLVMPTVVLVLMMIINPGMIGPGPTDVAAVTDAVTEKTLVPSLVTAQVSGFIFVLTVILLVHGRDWTRQLALRRPGLAHTLLILIGFPSLLVLGELAGVAARQILPSLKDILARLLPELGLRFPGLEEIVLKLRALPTTFGVLLVGVGPGVVEELWCRGFLGRGLVGRYGVLVGVLLTSFFFGVIHVDPQQSFYAMLMGIALHLVYLATRSLWLPILLHFLNNSAAIIHDKVPVLDTILPALEVLTPLTVGGAALLFVTVGWALYQSRARIRPEGVRAWEPDFPGVEHPPAGSGAVVSRPSPSLLSWALVLAAAVLFSAAVYRAAPEKKPQVEASAAAPAGVS